MFWGLFALMSWTIAVLAANVSAVLPAGFLGGLHASRLEGASLNQMRSQVAALEVESARLRQENTVLLQRFVLNEQASGEVARRVGALEQTLPNLVEVLNGGGGLGVDPTTTAAIGAGQVTTLPAEGGSVSYTTTPLVGLGAPVRQAASNLEMPAELGVAQPDSGAFGIALGPPIDADEGEASWQAMGNKVGTLLLGLGPLLANVEGGAGKRLVAGPIATEAEAMALCGRMAKVGIACASVPFVGTPLPLLN